MLLKNLLDVLPDTATINVTNSIDNTISIAVVGNVKYGSKKWYNRKVTHITAVGNELFINVPAPVPAE